MDPQTADSQQLALIAMYTSDMDTVQQVTNSYLAMQHDILIAILAAVVILGVCLIFRMQRPV